MDVECEWPRLVRDAKGFFQIPLQTRTKRWKISTNFQFPSFEAVPNYLIGTQHSTDPFSMWDFTIAQQMNKLISKACCDAAEIKLNPFWGESTLVISHWNVDM